MLLPTTIMNTEQKVYIITSTAEAGTPETMPSDERMELISHSDLATSSIVFSIDQKVCVTSEYSLDALMPKLDPKRREAVKILKDKFRFREVLANIYPDYTFRKIGIKEIAGLTVEHRCVIKPVRGIFGTAVRIVGPETDFRNLAGMLEEELSRNAKVYPDTVLSGGEFILEGFIEGEEYAVDMFYDVHGRPVIVNIMHHPIPRNEAYLHMMYNASAKAFAGILQPARSFFETLGKLLDLRNFMLHAELRLSNNRIIPVEINPMRFGGMGLCNLVWISHGINPFICYLDDFEPEWDKIWQGREEKVFSFFIAYNGQHVDVGHSIPRPDLLKQRFSKVLREVPFDHRRQLAFGVYFSEETEDSVNKLIDIEFDDFFDPDPGFPAGENKFAALILAAGLSERMGSPKAMLLWDEHVSFLEKLIDEYRNAGVGSIVCVVNDVIYYACAALHQPPGVTLVLNRNPERGRIHSIRLGLEALRAFPYCFLQNIDNPWPGIKTIFNLMEQAESDSWCSPGFQGRTGHPVLLSQKIVGEFLRDYSGLSTLKEFLSTYPKIWVEAEDDRILININTPQDLARWKPYQH
jgi:CTP:molybdopterin cytidylyltransferase MocA